MAQEKLINIRFPFRDSTKGHFIEMTNTTKDAIKSDLMHLLLTRKGERFYNPDFGTNLLKYIFEPNDTITQGEIKEDINNDVKRFLPSLTIDDISFSNTEIEEHIKCTIKFTINDGIFKSSDLLEIIL